MKKRLTKQEQQERARRVMELYYANASINEISKALSIPRPRVRSIIYDELNFVRQARKELSEKIFEADLERLNRLLRTVWLAFTAPCVECKGIGVFQHGEGVCQRCNGDGKLYSLEERLKAIREARQLISERAKLLGHYAPEKAEIDHTHTIDFHAQLSTMDEETLAQSLPMYQELLKTIENRNIGSFLDLDKPEPKALPSSRNKIASVSGDNVIELVAKRIENKAVENNVEESKVVENNGGEKEEKEEKEEKRMPKPNPYDRSYIPVIRLSHDGTIKADD